MPGLVAGPEDCRREEKEITPTLVLENFAPAVELEFTEAKVRYNRVR